MGAEFAAPVVESRGVIRLDNLLSGLHHRKLADTCVFCDQPADCGRICGSCRRIMPWNDSFCDCCGQAVPAGQPPGVICATCQGKRPPFEKARAPLTYDFPVDAVLKAIKFRRQLWYVPAFAELLLGRLQGEFADVDALLPVPLHRWRQMTRGFNQALELCRPLRKATGLPILAQAVRIRATSAQTGLNAAERRRNLKDAFAVAAKMQSRHPLIVDDVITTGETCSQLALELLKAGANSVSVLTVARAERHL
jgi:ComF family protein